MMRVFLRYSFRHFNNSTNQAHVKHRHINLQKDYYKMLEINITANETQIKKSYFRLAKIWHPDVNSKGHIRFTQIQEAYNILSNEQARQYYDKNNQFYPYDYQNQKKKGSNNTQSQDDINYRDQAFYEQVKKNKWSNFNEEDMKQSNNQKNSNYNQKEEDEDEEEAQKRKKFEDEINLIRQKLFTRNPIWMQANAFMNYEERERKIEQKRQELQTIFPKAMKRVDSFRKWIFRQ